MTTSEKMLYLAFGATKESLGWTEEDEKILQSLIPDPEKLMEVIKSK